MTRLRQTNSAMNKFKLPLAGTTAISVLAGLSLVLTGCSKTPQEAEADHMNKAKAYVDKKEYKKAVIEYKIASQNMPKDPEPRYQLGMTYLKAGAVPDAFQTFQATLKIVPNHLGTRYQIALLRVFSNDVLQVEDAKKAIEDYLASHPGDGEATAALAVAAAEQGKPDEAVKLLETASGKAPDSANRAATAIVQYYASRGNVDDARKVSKRMTELLPKSPEAAVLLAQVELATKDPAGADAEIQRALSLKKDFLPAMQLQLRRQLMTGNTAGAEETTKGLSKLPGKQLWTAYARMLFAEKKIEPGIKEYERVLQEHKDDADVRNEYAETLITSGKKKEAEAVLEGTLDKNKKDPRALLMRVSLEIDAGKLDAASKDVKQLLDMKAFSAPLSYQQSRIFAARRETVRQGDLLAEALKYNPRFFIARLELAQLLVAAGKPEAALETLEQATPNEKVSLEYRYYHNAALLAKGDTEQARKDVDACLAILKSPGFLYQDAILKGRAKDIAGARKSLEMAFAISPSEPGVLGLLGEVMREQKDTPKFIAMLREAVGKNPQSVQLHITLAGQLVATGDKAGARSELEAAKKAGDLVTAELDLAQMDLAENAAPKAEQRLSELIKTRDNGRARMLLADIAIRKGDAEAAIKQYLRVMQMEPENVNAMNNLAELLASKQKKYDDALFWAQKAMAAAPNNPAAADTLGWTYFRAGKYEAALPHLETSLRLMDRPTAHYHLAAAFLKTGSAARARTEYEAGVKQAPQAPARQEVAALFEGKK